jgi:V/A-type H+-transporting ATPase subunit G/H
MAKNNKRNGVVELWGHKFKKADDGLDKAEVVSFVDELMNKHEALLKRAEHLSSLTKLAEKTIVEADNIAQQVKSEAEEQAKSEAKTILSEAEEQARSEAKTILSEAEEQAQKLIEEKRAEALARVNREVEAIKAKAQQQAETLLEEKTREIQPELRNNVKRIYGELLTRLDGLKEQVVTLEEELEQKLSQPTAETKTLEEPNRVSVEAGRADNEFLELLKPTSETGEAEPEWELEILPPIDLTQILDIINYLDGMAEVEQTELIPQMDKPTITVFLRQPIDLVDILKTLPQVASITEDTEGGEGKPRKVQIELPRQTVTQQSN